MKVKKNSDGTVTVAIPKGAEEYHAEDVGLPGGGLYYTETMSSEDFSRASAAQPKALTDEERAEAAKKAAEASSAAASRNLALERAAERATAGQPSNVAIVADAVAKAEVSHSGTTVPEYAREAAVRVASDPGVSTSAPEKPATAEGPHPAKSAPSKAATAKAEAKAAADKKAADAAAVEKKAADSGSATDKRY